MSHEYNVNLKWNEGRVGEVFSPELNSKIEENGIFLRKILYLFNRTNSYPNF